ncbi:hypothetical protein MC885_019825 [Smutsia gigantea]|nr:hypothetical protein MC885_019825 [Smutsia gigantea]
MLEEHKAVILQKYARAWLARRRFQNIRRFVLNIQLTYRVQRLQKKLEDQNKENHGLVEKLTSLAALRAGDMEKIQKLESALDRAATHRHNYEENGKRCKATMEEKKWMTSPSNSSMILLEKSFELKTQDYEKQIWSVKEEIKALKDEKTQLQHRLEEERIICDGLKGEVARLSQQGKTISEFEKEIELLQTQKIDVEKHVQTQKREMREKMSEITKQLLESYDIEDKDCYEKEIEALNFKVVHLSQEINHLQKLFREENDINESIRHEVARLTSENMMIPDFKQQISELEKQKQDLEIRLNEQTENMKGKLEELSNQLTRSQEEEGTQRKTIETQNEIHTKEKEKLVDKIQEIREASEHLKKQFETESEDKSSFQQEASRLTMENRDLEEELDMKDRVIKKLQDQVKTLTKTIEKASDGPSGPKEYLGMLEYKREDEAKLIQNLILDLKPRGVVVNMIPGLPAHVLFMCVRYADSLNDASVLKSLMNSAINGIKQVVKEHLEDFEMLSFWLSNTCHFLNCLKQYSGEEEFMKHNSPHQNKNCLNNFDLSEYRQILSDVAIRIYHQFIIVMENNIQPIIVPGMLEYESLQGISGLKPTGFRKRSSSIDDTDTYTMTSVLQQLSYFYSTMCQNGLDPELVRQAVKQLFFLIGAITLNSLFLRKDMCSCRKGMQIRCNISYLEEWLKEKNLQNSLAKETLEPLSQAAWLLQVKKTTDSDAKEICERCTSLSAVQIIKILNSYTPIDDFEKRVTPSFVRKVQALLNTREDSSQLMLDTKYLFQVTFPFTPSPHALEMIQIPSSFKLGFLSRL